eukprot:GCRY01001272.1.p1 GENE.GCRY01001272.1~~GCRY01001272.1.p1  ORF type:complete len:564 (-),score=195.21 GCRY01001272.1:465-2156(-)
MGASLPVFGLVCAIALAHLVLVAVFYDKDKITEGVATYRLVWTSLTVIFAGVGIPKPSLGGFGLLLTALVALAGFILDLIEQSGTDTGDLGVNDANDEQVTVTIFDGVLSVLCFVGFFLGLVSGKDQSANRKVKPAEEKKVAEPGAVEKSGGAQNEADQKPAQLEEVLVGPRGSTPQPDEAPQQEQLSPVVQEKEQVPVKEVVVAKEEEKPEEVEDVEEEKLEDMPMQSPKEEKEEPEPDVAVAAEEETAENQEEAAAPEEEVAGEDLEEEKLEELPGEVPATEPEMSEEMRAAQELLKSMKATLGLGLANGPKIGVLVKGCKPGGPAEEAGLKKNDVIYSVDDIDTDNHADFEEVVAEAAPGECCPFVIRRGGVKQTLDVTFSGDGKNLDEIMVLRATAGAEFCETMDEAGKNRMKLKGKTVDTEVLEARRILRETKAFVQAELDHSPENGALVLSVVPDSGADRGGLKPNDLITSIDGIETNDRQQFNAALSDGAPGELVDVYVERDCIRVKLEMHMGAEGMALDEVLRLRALAGEAFCEDIDDAGKQRKGVALVIDEDQA